MDRKSVKAVDALGCFAAVVDTLGADTLAAGVVEPAVLGPAHGLAVLLTLADGHTVVEVHHRTHLIWRERERGVRKPHRYDTHTWTTSHQCVCGSTSDTEQKNHALINQNFDMQSNRVTEKILI